MSTTLFIVLLCAGVINAFIAYMITHITINSLTKEKTGNVDEIALLVVMLFLFVVSNIAITWFHFFNLFSTT